MLLNTSVFIEQKLSQYFIASQVGLPAGELGKEGTLKPNPAPPAAAPPPWETPPSAAAPPPAAAPAPTPSPFTLSSSLLIISSVSANAWITVAWNLKENVK